MYLKSLIIIPCYKKDFISHFGLIGSYNPWCAGQGAGSIFEISRAEYLPCVWPLFLGTQEHRMSQLLMVNGAKTELWSTNCRRKWCTHIMQLGPQPPAWSSVLFVCALSASGLERTRGVGVGGFKALKHEQGRRSLVPWATVWRIVA